MICQVAMFLVNSRIKNLPSSFIRDMRNTSFYIVIAIGCFIVFSCNLGMCLLRL